MPTFAITGGAGFIGSNLAWRLSTLGTVLVADDLSSGHAANLDGIDASFLEMDVSTHVFGSELEQVARIFHLAASIDGGRNRGTRRGSAERSRW